MKLIILNGPTGTGKNTISQILAKNIDKSVVIDFDVVRNMFVNPHLAPWDGDAGHRQNLMGVEFVCTLAKQFLINSYNIIILDVLTNETANLYKEKLREYNSQFVFLMPSFDVIKERNTTRPPRLTDEELEMVYKQQETLNVYDLKIDNSNLKPEDVANIVLEKFNLSP